MTMVEAKVIDPKPTASECWKEINSRAQFMLFIVFVVGAIGNIFGAIMMILVNYYWFAPWMFNLAKEHNRNVSWAYAYGCCGLIIMLIYWIYVKLTKDPIGDE